MSQQQDFTARPYQYELYEKAVEENSIIYLPTGSGKTYIAVLVIKKLSEALHKPYESSGKRTIFTVNTVALVQQQTSYLSRHTGLEVKGYSGDQVDNWTEIEWLREITSCQVMVMTAQIFLDLLEHGIMPLSKVNLLIFDECHHAVKDHPMRQIMQRFKNWPANQLPRVLGLSASLLNANITSNNWDKIVKELEITFQAKIITVSTLETVSAFSTKPKEVIELYDPLNKHKIIDIISGVINSANALLETLENAYVKEVYKNSSSTFRPDSRTKKLTRIFCDIDGSLEEMGLYGGLKCTLLHIIQVDSIKKSTKDKNFVNLLNAIITQLIKIQKLISDQIEGIMSQDFLVKYASPKVSKLVEYLKKFYLTQENKNKFCCIIFVQRRFTAKVLYHILKELSLQNDDFKFLVPGYVVGQNNDSYRNAKEQLCMSQWNKDILSKFKNGTINCIVATEVIDEGIDVPLCTLVVRFYAPMDFRSYVQSKGRARHFTSHFVTLVSSHDHSYSKRYEEYKNMESRLQEELHGRSIRQAPTTDEIGKTLYDYEIEPFIITRTNGQKSILTEQNAIPLINTYCSSLSTSKYSSIAPNWVKENIEVPPATQYKVHLTLPVASSLRDTITSDQCTSITSAKRSAAFKTCVKLYEIGELDDSLAPRNKRAAMENAQFLYPHMQSKDTKTLKNSRNKYQLAYPEAWFGAYPKANIVLHLHIFKMIPKNSESISRGKHSAFHSILAKKETFGILSTKPMPEMPTFPVFPSAGDFQVNIEINKSVSPLTQSEINELKQFHYLIFNDILTVSKDFTVFDSENQENCFLIVPVDGNQTINWNVVKSNNHITTIQPDKPLKVTSSDYKHSLILPIYRASSAYLVTEVCTQIRPKSPFPDRRYNSYADYFEMKHNLKIENLNQPMLKVRPLSTEMNWLKPRPTKTTMNNEECLVPELCKKIAFPAVYWIKASAIPSILHRLSQLLVAEELRVLIAKEANLILDRSLASNWDPLTVTESWRKRFDSGIASKDTVSSNKALDSGMSTAGISLSLDLSFDSLSSKEQEPLHLEIDADRLKPSDLDYYNKFMSNMTIKNRADWNEQAPNLKIFSITNSQGPSSVDILQSLTGKSSNDILDYERLENLGDSFLKYAISLYLYQIFPNYGENSLTELKGKMVSNLNFLCCGELKNLGGRINVDEFDPAANCLVPAFDVDQIVKKLLIDTNMPANLLYDIKIPPEEQFSGVMSKETSKKFKECVLNSIRNKKKSTGAERFLGIQLVSQKCVSDCVEAIIGVYLERLGVEGALKVTKWFEILPKSANVEEFLVNSAVKNPRKRSGYVEEHMPWASLIERRIGYSFSERAFLLQAFTHQTYNLNRITDSYERLEFLGDAVLDFLLTAYIYETCGNLDPGELTDLRSALVNNITFGCLCVRYGLHTALLDCTRELSTDIDKFVEFQENRHYKVDDELLLVLLEEEDCNMAEYITVPKVLGDLFESVIGAVYLDSGKDLKVTWKVIYNLMKTELETFSNNVPKQPIRVILEMTGVNPKFSPSELVAGTDKVMVQLSINDGEKRVIFNGFGSTKKSAKCAASKQAIKYLHSKKKMSSDARKSLYIYK